MARTLSITADKDELTTIVTKALQSSHINFLLGSGASMPAIGAAGSIETELDVLAELDPDGFVIKKHDFLSAIQASTNDLIDGTESPQNVVTLTNYRRFLEFVSHVLNERKTDLLPKQVTIFTTNYDLFVERASEDMVDLRLNDGFTRNPVVHASYTFQPEHYFDITFKTGTLFRYRFPIPTVNLIKLHGSVSWEFSDELLGYNVEKRALPQENSDAFSQEVQKFLDSFSLVLPGQQKFQQTLLTRVYYDLLRIFANTLEVENTTLFCFGFSFDDEHIFDIVARALKNPTLLVLIVSYDKASGVAYEEKFKRHNNVLVFHPEDEEKVDFLRLNTILADIIPQINYAN